MAKKKASKKASRKAGKKTAASAGAVNVVSAAAVDAAEVRMYRIGTGDCLVVKFFSGAAHTFTMMIDCGAWQGTKEKFAEYVTDLKDYVGGKVDVLVVTHEHKDHVLGFEKCEDLLTDGFEVGQTWMAWTEKDGDPEVEKWKDEDGLKKRKMALAGAAAKLSEAVDSPAFANEMGALHRGGEMLRAHQHFVDVLKNFAELQMALDADGAYAGALKGMKIAKEKIAGDNIKYFKPGDVIEDIAGLGGIRIYVLGPPRDMDSVQTEDSGKDGETYRHNKELAKGDAFTLAVDALVSGEVTSDLLPFDSAFEATGADPARNAYENAANTWRRIDLDWLRSAGGLALRLNTGINNLSLALAIEFVESGRVMLFPGDAEYGSWASWHEIGWQEQGRSKNADGTPKHLTEDLLNRTVFYKVAHHLSHNGTARRKGMEMMTAKGLAAMATLDYGVISPSWKGTMPNQALLDDLLAKTKGRLMVMQTDDIFYDARKEVPLSGKIDEARERMTASELSAFDTAHQETDHYIQYRVAG